MRSSASLHAAIVLTILSMIPLASPALGEDWAQFRGPNAGGVAEERSGAEYPERIAADAPARWVVSLPPGISSPCVQADRVYLTALEGTNLVTLALDRANGAVVWKAAAPADRIEEVHTIGSPATPTPTCDGERVYVFFGSYGLLAYEKDGKPAWKTPLGPFKNNYGQASSPIVWRDRIFLNCDQDIGSFLLAVDRRDGRKLWETPRPGFPRGFSTPVMWSEAEKNSSQVLVAGTLRLIAYDPADGKELWSIGGLARIVNSTPVLGDGLVYVSSYAPGGDDGDRISMVPFSEFARENDRNKDGALVLAEIPEGPFLSRFPQIDADKDGRITPAEWSAMEKIFEAAHNSIFALKPGAGSEPAERSVLWRYDRSIPYVPSPLYHKGLVYIVKDGGILTCLDGRSGKVYKQARLPAAGNYYASPVAAGDKIYTISRDGGVCVLRAGKEWVVTAEGKLGDTCMATPALADGQVFLRTEKKLYCFART